jgi:hypothetical protein
LAKKGEKYKCEECALLVVVEQPYCCETVELLCSEVPMKPVKVAAKPKPKPKTEKN